MSATCRPMAYTPTRRVSPRFWRTSGKVSNRCCRVEVQGVAMAKVWLKEYPPGIPSEIDPGEYASLKALLEDCLSRYADRDAFVQMGTKITYAELDRKSAAFAAWLQAQGLKKGDRI